MTTPKILCLVLRIFAVQTLYYTSFLPRSSTFANQIRKIQG